MHHPDIVISAAQATSKERGYVVATKCRVRRCNPNRSKAAPSTVCAIIPQFLINEGTFVLLRDAREAFFVRFVQLSETLRVGAHVRLPEIIALEQQRRIHRPGKSIGRAIR
jgi:hypothetical protein